MKNTPLNGFLLGAAMLVVLFYGLYIARGVRECARRGGVPVLLPTGTQCAAKLR
jgi:hypothetical protein